MLGNSLPVQVFPSQLSVKAILPLMRIALLRLTQHFQDCNIVGLLIKRSSIAEVFVDYELLTWQLCFQVSSNVSVDFVNYL